MLPTVLVTVCVSTIINGTLFFVVGYFKLGNVLHFFPRHVIMGMTAGFGVFLMSTAVESSTGIVEAEQNPLSFVHALSTTMIYQLVIVLVFEMLLRLSEYFKCNELVVPCMIFFLPVLFYLVLAASGTSSVVDLVVGALFSSRKALDSLEYTSALFIAMIVSLVGFVPGIFMCVVSACVTFIVQSSRQSSIEALFSGDTARSNSSWSARQRDKLDLGLALLGGGSIIVVQLQGHLFFGNVQQVVKGIENALIADLTTEAGDTGAGSSPSSQLKHQGRTWWSGVTVRAATTARAA
jgi:MFS superfamily sulfate permease-like transporter